MNIIYFDICSIPVFLIILFVCYTRRMTRGSVNQLFILLVLFSLFSAAADLGMEVPDAMLPLSDTALFICKVSSYVYLALRNATNAVLLLFLLAYTRTTFRIRTKWVRVAYCIPYACILLMLLQNPFTHSAFTVTREAGYSRGPLMLAFYGIAMIYGIIGLIYCIYCRRYLSLGNWGALLSIYVLVHLAVLIQFFYPQLLVEMFFTAIAEMIILVTIMRPEERMDKEVEMLSWTSYQTDLRNVILSGQHVSIIVIKMINAPEIRNFMGDHDFYSYISEIADGIRKMHWNHPYTIDLYYERPGTIYLIIDNDEPDMDNIGSRIISEAGENIKRYAEMGVRFEPRVCLINCPEDLHNVDDIVSLGHIFHKLDNFSQNTCRAGEIVGSRSFAIEAHIADILNRAIKENHIEMYYQPIYDMKSGRFHSAEALARIIDPEYGLISPAIFIPAAETQGYIIPIGDSVLDQVFRFISEHDLDSLGLSYIEVNLSVAQCMERSLPDKIRSLQQKYNVDPGKVNLEITETTFEDINDIMVENVNKLIQMGYSFALDDYGTGYSSIQRVNHIPLKLIKIDKSMLDEVSSANGWMILNHTIRMMQSIGKHIVTEGAETEEAVENLRRMKCDYIQGFYFSRPLPADEFVRFIEKQNSMDDKARLIGQGVS